jgi:hypothetical protein
MQGRNTLQIQVPTIYKDVVPLGTSNIAIEHAPLNSRIKETLLADVLSEVLSSDFQVFESLIVARDINRVRNRFVTWAAQAGINFKPKNKGFTFNNGCTIWFFHPKDVNLDDLPFIGLLHRCVICDAHALSQTTFDLLDKNSEFTVCAGNKTSRDHWLYRFNHREDVSLYSFPASAIVGQFPDQKDELTRLRKSYSSDEQRRYLNLEDIEIKHSNFARFARTRLWIKTDRDVRSLHPEQQKHAKDTEGTPIVPYYLTPLNKRYLAMKRLAVKQGKKKRYLLLKYRRGGFTTLEQAMSYNQCTEFPYSQCITLAHTHKSTQRIFRIAKLYHERDPRRLALASDSKSELEFADNGSVFFIGTAGGHGVSRGDTIQRAHGSEVAKWCPGPDQKENVEDIVAGLLGAASHGEVILETTPDGFEWFANTYQDAKKSLNDWVPLFLPWFVDPVNVVYNCNVEEIRDTFTEEEKKFTEKVFRDWHMTISPQQIAFRRSKKREYGRLFRQEFPEDDITCFIVSGDPFFNVELIMDMLDSIPEWQHTHLPGGYRIRFKEPIAGRKYVCGTDTSEGLPSSDPNGFGILDKESGEQVCTVHGRFPFNQLAVLAVEECLYYNRALLGIERNNHGHAVLQRVVELGYKKPHYVGGPLFHFDKDRPGWDTNSATRPVLIDELSEAVEQKFMEVRDREFLSECLTFKKQANGKYEADTGCHDDIVIKWGIAWQMRKQKRPRISYSEAG